MINKGDLVRGVNSGLLYQVTRGIYTARFADSPSDHDMYECGMGHLAGTYETAIDVVALSGDGIGNEFRKQRVVIFARVVDESR